MGGLISLIRHQAELVDILIYLLSVVTILFLTLPIHEYAHAFAATRLGDPTPKYQGRLKLNPLAHIDPIGAVCMVLFGFGWGRAVQVNGRYFDNPKRDMAITALAGPMSNLVVAFASLLFMNVSLLLLQFGMAWYYVYLFFSYLASINIYLAVFNLIPVPPLDGSRILTAFLPDRIYYRIMQYERYIIFAVILLIYMGVLDVPLSFLSDTIYDGLNFVASLPARLILNFMY